jgi:hypothetical protein
MMEILKRKEVWFKLLLLVVFVFLFITAIPYPLKSKQFPQLVAIFTLIVIALSLITDFIGKPAPAGGKTENNNELAVNDGAADRAMNRRFYEAWAIILVSTAIGFLAGFLFLSFFLFLGFALRSESRKKLLQNIVIAVLSTVIIYFTFDWMMAIPLLDGILW